MKLKSYFFLLASSLLALFSVILLLSAQGCSSIRYYHQAAAGQYEVLATREDISELIQSPDISPELKAKLQIVLDARDFATREMKMEVGDSYTQYSDLKRDYVVWNVTASPALDLAPYQWCYPIIGCQSYRGYFHEVMAQDMASQLDTEGYDTWVSGIAAYSTLGWFEDPVLNTFIHRDDADLFALIIHELSHQVLYIKGDTTFNESFATAVELEGVKRWLNDNKQHTMFAGYAQKLEEKEHFISTVSATIDQLKALYASSLPDKDKKTKKYQLIEALKVKYHDDVKEKNLKGYFTHWFNRVNNAKLASIANYYEYVPAFSLMIAEVDGNMDVFYERVLQLSEQDKTQRDEVLHRYLTQADAGTKAVQTKNKP